VNIEVKTVPLSEIRIEKDLKDIRHSKSYDVTKLDTLKKSLGRDGQYIPILVTKVEDGYRLVAGHRRYHALSQLQDESKQPQNILVSVMEGEFDKAKQAKLAAIENCQRQDLDRDERNRLIKLLSQENFTKTEICGIVGLGDTQVERILQVLNNAKMAEYVERNVLTMTDAQQMLDATGESPEKKALAYDVLARFERESKKVIDEKLAKASENNKTVGEDAKKPVTYLAKKVFKSWTAAISAGKRPVASGRWVYTAGYEKDKALIDIESLKIKPSTAPVRNLLYVLYKLTDVIRDLESNITQRRDEDDGVIPVYDGEKKFEDFCRSKGFDPRPHVEAVTEAAEPSGPAPTRAEEVMQVQA